MIRVADILNSGGKHPKRVQFASPSIIANAQVLCERVNALMRDLGIDLEPSKITDGFRLQWANYGAKRSWHKKAGAVDFDDPEHTVAHQITRVLLLKHKMRREDTDYTRKVRDDGTIVDWCHLDIGEPYGSVFKP